jgi:FSR family fosmidomycin resistance protein-like MFS transporter
MTREEKMVVALTGCSHALSHGYLLIFPAVLLLLQKEFSLGYLQLGIIGNIMSFSYGLGALPGGMIYNRMGPKRLFLLCFLGSSLVALFIAVSSRLILFAIGLALLGALGSVYHPLANALITSKVREYGRALGIHGAAGNMGLAAAPFLAGLIASAYGWRMAYLGFAIPGVAIAVWVLLMDVSPAKEEENASSPQDGSMSIPRDLGRYFSPPLICLYTANLLNSFCFYGSMTFLPTYMAKFAAFRIFSLDSVAIGGMLSGIVLLMGAVGQFTGGMMAQRPGVEKKFLWVALLAFPSLLAMSFSSHLLLLTVALVYYFFNFSLQPMSNTLLARHTSGDMRATAFGIYFSFAFGIGSSASSYSGYIAERFGLQWVFAGLSISTLLLIGIVYIFIHLKKPAILAWEGGSMRPGIGQ